MKKRKPGKANRRAFFGNLAAPLTGAVLALAPIASAADKEKKKQPVTDTLIKVTTFSELGATVKGARVRLIPADKDGKPVKGKTQNGQTNGMGEYPFYVPKTEATYVLRAEAKGYETTDKVVAVRGEDQLDIFLQIPQKK